VIGLLTLWPIIYFVLFLAFISYAFATMNTTGRNSVADFGFKYIFIVHPLTIVLMFALMAIYIIHAFKTDRIPQDKKVLWVVVLFFGSIMAFPIYWYLYMWKPIAAGPSSQTADPRGVGG
jgi:hypothetical protein